MAAAYILKKNLKIDACPVAGAAFYCVNSSEKNDVISFAKIEENADEISIESNETSFHCWVESGDWVIDFMTPLFGISPKEFGLSAPIPIRMFQKKKSEMKRSIHLHNVGDYFILPNQELTNELLLENLARNDIKDLLEIASHWFKPATRRMLREMPIASNDGIVTIMKIKPILLNSKW